MSLVQLGAVSPAKDEVGSLTRAKADSPSVSCWLLCSPSAVESLRKIGHEYSLRNERDAAWAILKSRRHNVASTCMGLATANDKTSGQSAAWFLKKADPSTKSAW